MHNRKRIVAIALVACMAVGALIYFIIPRPAAQATVLLIIPSTSDSYWVSILSGARSAANRLGVTLLTDTMESGEAETLARIRRERVSALVVAPTENMKDILALLTDANLPTVFLCSSQTHESIVSRVLSVPASTNQKLSDLVREKIGFQSKVALLCGNPSDESAHEDEMTLRRDLGDFGTRIERVYAMNDEQTAYENALRLLADASYKAIIALGLHETEGLVRAARETSTEATLFGYDVSDAVVAALEDGTLTAVQVRNAFSIGYQGVNTICRAIRGESVMYDILVFSLLATRDSLYDPDFERIIFAGEDGSSEY